MITTLHEYKFKPYGKNTGVWHHEIEIEKETAKTYKLDSNKTYSYNSTLKKSELGKIGWDYIMFTEERMDDEVKRRYTDAKQRELESLRNKIKILEAEIKLLEEDVIEYDVSNEW